MTSRYQRVAIVLLAAASLSPAFADSASTLGGLVVKSEDGNFVFSLGGRVHFDYTGILPDSGSGFDSGAAENLSGFYFRRVFVSLAGQLYGFRYRLDYDLSNSNNPSNGLQDAFISRDFGSYGTLRVGQTKPWRSFDELTSNNDKIFTERNLVSATGLLGGRDYQEGLFYRYGSSQWLSSRDHLWLGTSVYSLARAGTVNSPAGANSSTQGTGYNVRIAYAPIVESNRWLHLASSYSSDHADNGAKLTSGASAWYSIRGVSQNVASLAGVQPSTLPTSAPGAKIPGGNNPQAEIITGELAGVWGPVFFLGEYGRERLSQHAAPAAGIPSSQTVEALSLTSSVYLTGESKGYDISVAALGSPKPIHPWGAVELAVRYDFIRNLDLPPGNTADCKPAIGSIPAGSAIDKCRITQLAFGINYYATSNIRLMLDYDLGTLDLGSAGKDKPSAINTRFQLLF